MPYLKNKFILTSVVFLAYGLFLDEHDIFSILKQKRKLKKIEASIAETNTELEKTQKILHKLNNLDEVEKFAREKKFFKRDNEDVFVIYNDNQ